MAVGNGPARPRILAGPLGSVVIEALDRLVTAETRDAILLTAVQHSDSGLPNAPAALTAFVTGPLFDAVADRLGQEAANALLADLAPIVRRASTSQITTGVRDRDELEEDRPVLLVAAQEPLDPRDRELLAGTARVQPVEDIFALLSATEEHITSELVVIIDCRLPSVRSGSMGALSRVLPPSARVVLWAADDRTEEILRDLPAARLWARVSREVPIREVLARSATTDAEAEIETLPPPALRRTALVVEEAGAGRAALVSLLERHGYHVVVAADPYLALTKLLERRPDVAIVDFDSPLIAGPKLAGMVKDMLSVHAPPIVARVPRAGSGVYPMVEQLLPRGADPATVLELLDVVIRARS